MPSSSDVVDCASFVQLKPLECAVKPKHETAYNDITTRRKILPDVYEKSCYGKIPINNARQGKRTEVQRQSTRQQHAFSSKDISRCSSYPELKNLSNIIDSATAENCDHLILTSSTRFPHDNTKSHRLPNHFKTDETKLKRNNTRLTTDFPIRAIPPYRKRADYCRSLDEGNSITTSLRSLSLLSKQYSNNTNTWRNSEFFGFGPVRSILKNRQMSKSDSTSDTSSISSHTDGELQTDCYQNVNQSNITPPPLPRNLVTKKDLSFKASRSSTSIAQSNCMDAQKQLRFNPRIWVHEFHPMHSGDAWFSESDLQHFKVEAVSRIRRRWSMEGLRGNNKTKTDGPNNYIISSGTGRIIVLPASSTTSGPAVPMKALYSDPALSVDWEEEEDKDNSHLSLSTLLYPSGLSSGNEGRENRISNAVKYELRSVLFVDPLDIFLELLSKGIRFMLPHIVVSTAHSSEQARKKIFEASHNTSLRQGQCTHGFDIIVVEERLGSHKLEMFDSSTNKLKQNKADLSGSNLIKCIKSDIELMENSVRHQRDSNNVKPRFPLLIGMSAHIEQHKKVLQESGSDCLWGKPPPPMNYYMKNEILRLVMLKRNRGSL